MCISTKFDNSLICKLLALLSYTWLKESLSGSVSQSKETSVKQIFYQKFCGNSLKEDLKACLDLVLSN